MMSHLAVVTGGTKGIGAAIVEKLIDKDYKVICTYHRDAAAAQRLQARFGDAVTVVSADCSLPVGVASLMARITAAGTPDILINNAGITGDSLLLNQNYDAFMHVFNSCFLGVVQLTQALMPLMLAKRHGNIVNISSVAAQKVKSGNCSYGCAKAAIERYTRGLALETARFNIQVNAVAPGFVDTDMFRQFAGDNVGNIIKSIPGRKIHPADKIAEVVLRLALREIDTTGSIINIGYGENI